MRRRARAWPDVPGRRPDETAGSLLLEDVGRPAGDPCAAEHRGRELGGDLGDVEHDRGPVLDVRLELAVRRPLAQHLQRRLLERRRDLDAGRAELHRRPPQHRRARVVRPIDAVAEAHDPLTAVEQVPDVLLGIVRLGRAVDHRQHPRRRAAVEGAGERADGGAHRRRAVGAGRCRDAGGEGGRVQAVLRGGDPVRVERLDVARVRLAAPPDQELRRRVLALRDLVVRNRRLESAGGLRDDRQRRRRETGEVVAGLLVVDVDELLHPPLRPQRRQRRLQVGGHGPARILELDLLRRRERRDADPRRRGGPTRSRTGNGRPGPRCRHRGSGASRRPCPAPRSPSRRRSHPRARGGSHSWRSSSADSIGCASRDRVGTLPSRWHTA